MGVTHVRVTLTIPSTEGRASVPRRIFDSVGVSCLGPTGTGYPGLPDTTPKLTTLGVSWFKGFPSRKSRYYQDTTEESASSLV